MTYSNADFTPGMKGYSDIKPFRFWCQKVLPLVYDDSLSYYELLCKVVDYINNIITDLATTEENVGALLNAYNQLQDYVNNYFTNLDVQEEINIKLDNLVEDGTLTTLIGNYIQPRIDKINEELDNYQAQMNAQYDTFETRMHADVTTQNNKIAVLEGRMNTFSSLTQGSTTGDAELQDIRVGYNGVIYPTAGNAVREQVKFLNNNVDGSISIIQNIANPALKVLNERYGNTNPVTTRAEQGYQRLEVPVKEGQTYSIWKINTSFSFFSNDNYDNLGAISTQGDLTIPTGCNKLLLTYQYQTTDFVVINSGGYLENSYTYNQPLKITYSAFDINDYSAEIELMTSTRNIANPSNVVLNERYRNSDPVTTQVQENYQRLEVPVIANKDYSVWNINTAFSIFSNDSNENLGLVSNQGTITTPENCTKLLLTYQYQTSPFIVINDGGYPNGDYAYNVPIEEDLETYDYTSIAMFEKIAVVGDSYESGGLYGITGVTDGPYYSISWPEVLGRRNGVEINNYSAPGRSTRTWLTDENRGLAKALADAPSGLYMLCLGINDYGLTDYLGTPADMTEDYTQNPDTFYGNYARIIEQLQAHAPNAKFIFVIPPLIAGEFATAIVNIAAHYSIPYFRSDSDGFFLSKFYTQNMSTAHPVAMTYAGMTLAYERLVSVCIQKNTSYFFNYKGVA